MRKIRTTSEDAECFRMYFDLQVNGYAGADSTEINSRTISCWKPAGDCATTEWPASWPR